MAKSLDNTARNADTLRSMIRNAGLRSTPSRVAVLEMLVRVDSPISHGDVADKLEKKGWDKATLYRNLLDLTRAGLARRSDMGDHVWRFEAIRPGGDDKEHPHFVCNTCGTVECMEDLAVVSKQGSRMPKAVRDKAVEIQIKGTCDRCI